MRDSRGIEKTAFGHLKKLVSFRTNVFDDEGFSSHNRCNDYLAGELERLGFSTRRFEFEGRPSVVGWRGKENSRTFVFNGHFDIAADNQDWNGFHLTESELNGREIIRGKATADMKAGIACFLAGLEGMEFSEKSGRVAAMFVSDEETGGTRGTKAVLAKCLAEKIIPENKSFVVVGEPTKLEVTTKRRASYLYRIRIPRNREMHSASGLKKVTENARPLHSAHTSVSAFRDGRQKHPLFELSQKYFAGKLMGVQEIRVGGVSESLHSSAPNVVPSIGRAYFDPKRIPESGSHALLLFIQKLFFPPFHSNFSHYGITICPNRLERMEHEYVLWLDIRIMNNNRRQMNQSVSRLAKECGIPKSGVSLFRHKHSLEEDGKWPKTVSDAASRVLGFPVSHMQEGRGQSDASFFAEKGIPVVELGCEGANWHSPNEFITKHSLRVLPKIYAETIKAALA